MNTATRVALKTGTQLAKIGCRAYNLKTTLTRTKEDQVTAVKRSLRTARWAAEDFIDETAFSIKRHPLKSLAVTFGLAFALGTCLRAFAKRK